jgi:poly(hydroxyalkanoate) granule-associated protein
MAKKLSETVDDHEQQLAQAVRTSAQQIWQAGLGAFVKAQQEEHAAGGGEQAFQRLVEEGSVLQQRVRASGELEDSEDSEDSEDGKLPAGRSWDKLEQVFEDRVVRALSAIGVPSKRDLDGLREQISQLSEQVAQLQRRLDDNGSS